jgi:hypothetical protein
MRGSLTQRQGLLVCAAAAMTLYSGLIIGQRLLNKGTWSAQRHYAYLAHALLNGRVHLAADEAPWLDEIVTIDGKRYVVYPPMPAVMLMPYVAIFGADAPVVPVSLFLSACVIGLLYVVLCRAGTGQEATLWLSAVFTLGSPFWYSALKGSSWHFAHVTALLWLLLALAETLGRQRGLLIGLCLGAATLCRLPLLMSIPVVVVLLIMRNRSSLRPALECLAGAGIFIGAMVAYNWVRYQTITDYGYTHLAAGMGIAAEALFHPRNIPRNLWMAFFQPPLLTINFPYLIPTTFGLGLMFVMPALLLAFRSPFDATARLAAFSAMLVAIPSLCYRLGAHNLQFGFRYALDYVPFLLILAAKGIGQTLSFRVRWLLASNIAIGLWGMAFLSRAEPPWLAMLEAYNQ